MLIMSDSSNEHLKLFV